MALIRLSRLDPSVSQCIRDHIDARGVKAVANDLEVSPYAAAAGAAGLLQTVSMVSHLTQNASHLGAAALPRVVGGN